MGQNLVTRSTYGFPIRDTNSTDASYPARAARLTAPTGIGDAAAQTTFGILDLTANFDSDGFAQNSIQLMPFGTGTDTQTFKMMVLGWRKCWNRAKTGPPFWRYVELCELLCTLSVQPTCIAGVAGSFLSVDNYFADTISIQGTGGNDDISIDIVSPADNRPAHAVLAVKGEQKLEIIFDRNSSASSCNCMVATL